MEKIKKSIYLETETESNLWWTSLKEVVLIMKKYSIILKVIFAVALGQFIGRIVTPLFGLESL